MIELRHADDNAVTDIDLLGLHRTRGQEQLGRRTVRVLFQKMVLDRPDLIKADLVGQPDLFQGVHIHGPLGFPIPGTRHGQFVENTKLHDDLLQKIRR